MSTGPATIEAISDNQRIGLIEELKDDVDMEVGSMADLHLCAHNVNPQTLLCPFLGSGALYGAHWGRRYQSPSVKFTVVQAWSRQSILLPTMGDHGI